MKIKKTFMTGLIFGLFFAFLPIIIMGSISEKSPVSSTYIDPQPYSLIYKTSRDGMKIYSYGDYVIVKTNNSVSITN